MDISNISITQNEKKLNKITAILILVGAVTSLCLVFFFYQLFNAKNNSVTPKIFKAEQIGSTDSSILLVWSSSDAAKQFIVKYRSTDSSEYSEFTTDKPFAAIHGLKANKRYKAVVAPFDGVNEYEPVTVICNTSSFCRVTDVNVDTVTNSSAHIAWNYEGMNGGFTVVAYALDQNGKRHVTSQQVTTAPGSANECILENLLSELHYTVCVMPNTRYAEVGKSTFTTEKYSKEYNLLNIVRFVICLKDSSDSMHVSTVTNLEPNQDYMTSMIISGDTNSDHKIECKLYITDQEGNIISDFTKPDVYTNPENKASYAYRTITMDFTAPEQPGDYMIFAVFDNVTVRKNTFKVI